MTRAATAVLLAVALVAAIGIARFGWGGGDSDYRVAAVFDTAKGIVPGQNVKIAGSRVGKVTAVDLETTRNGGYKARIELSVDGRFAPFRANARCNILPEGLISENFVDCDPGSASAPPLDAGPSGLPTVRLASTTVPASLQDIFNTFPLTTRERARILIGELGIATAGRGEDLNAVLRRANPALTQAARVLSILGDQRRGLSAAVRDTDRVLTELAGHERAVRTFVARTATVSRTTAARRDALEASVRRLPRLLTAIDGSLDPLERVARSGTPLLRDLRAAGPPLERFNRVLPEFAGPGVTALRSLGDVASRARRAVPRTRRVAASLARFSRPAGEAAALLAPLLTSTRDGGGIEGLNHLWYGISSATSGYDSVSHFATVMMQTVPRCIFANAMTPDDVPTGCSHAYTAPGHGRIPVTHSPGAGESAGARSRLTQEQMTAFLDYLLK